MFITNMLGSFFRVLSRGRLTVLLFHKVPEVKNPLVPAELDLAGFERVLALAQRIFRILPFEDALLGLRAGNLPAGAACITFDDGYPDWLRGVVPLLDRYKVHATFFVTTGQFHGLPMWNERILYAVTNAPADTRTLELPSIGEPVLSFDTVAHRQAAIHQLDRLLKYEEPEEKERLLQAVERHAGFELGKVPTMSVSELRDLHARGFGIGGHAVTHPILSRCTSEQAYAEIGGAREELELIVRGKVSAFAYPNGVPMRDFGPEHIGMVKRAGYRSAVTTYRGAATAQTSLFQIPRFTPWGPSDAKMYLQVARNLIQAPGELEEEDANARRALMVAFHFPPQAGSSGILRTLNFVKHLPGKGWDASLLTARPKAYDQQRNDLVSSIPPDTRVIRAHAVDAAKHLSILGKYPSLFALPDRWSTWWVPAVLAGLREIKRQRPNLIWSTYPISTAHLIGGTLARFSGLPWVADFRDPMISAGYPSNKLQRKTWQWLERYTLKNAAACVFTTQHAAKEYGSRYPFAAARCMVIENGYDEQAFNGVKPERFGTPADKQLLLHSGLIYPKDRNPSTFFAAVNALIELGQLDRGRLCIRFRAPQHDAEVSKYAAQFGLDDIVEVAPSMPYHQAIAEMMGADVLLVFQGSHFNAQIPAKIYEYLRASRPIIAIVDPQGDTAAQLAQFEAVSVGDIASEESIKAALLNAMLATEDLTQAHAFERNLKRVLPFSRESQASRLVQQFDFISS